MKNKPASKAEPPPPATTSDPTQPGDRAATAAKAACEPLKLARILVPVDFSDCSLRALDYALAMAERFGSELVLLHVVEPAVYPENYLVASPGLDETNQNLMEVARERLSALRTKHLGSRLPTETLVRMGRAHSEIPDTAKALGVDLIILGTHGYTGLKHVLLGSTAERVVRHAPCPVLTVRHPGSEPAA